MQQTESQLRTLFNEIDINHDGKLDRHELSSACQRAGLAVSNAKLDRFFEKIDSNNDGSLSFREWASVFPICPILTYSEQHLTHMRTATNNILTAISSYLSPPMNQTSEKSYPIFRPP